MPQIRNSADSLTHLLTRVKSRDASASKNVTDERTDGRTDKAFLGVGLSRNIRTLNNSVIPLSGYFSSVLYLFVLIFKAKLEY